MTYLPTQDARATFITHLDEESIERMCLHLKRLVAQQRGYALQPEQAAQLRSALAPHKRILKRLLSLPTGQKSYMVRQARRQKGEGFGIIALLLSALAPIISRAIMGKKK